MIPKLFNLVKKYAYKIRSQEKDGEKGWKQIKPIFEKSDVKFNLNVKFVELLENVNFERYNLENDQDVSVTLNGITLNNLNSNGNLNDRNHFIVQLFRIPKLKTEVKDGQRLLAIMYVLQIAYNIGQYLAVKEQYPPEVIDFIEKNRLDKISTFVDIEKN